MPSFSCRSLLALGALGLLASTAASHAPRWVNPHSNLTVVDTADASRKTWSIEMSSPGVLTRSGWTKRTFNTGDKIKLTFAPLRNGDAGGHFFEATLADGRVLTYSVQLPIE